MEVIGSTQRPGVEGEVETGVLVVCNGGLWLVRVPDAAPCPLEDLPKKDWEKWRREGFANTGQFK